MRFFSWLETLKLAPSRRRAERGEARGVRRRSPWARPSVEALEDRCVPSYSVIDLGTLGGSYSQGNDINASGQVVGRSTLSDGTGHAFLWQNGIMTDLGTLGTLGAFSSALGINDFGQIVGYSGGDGGGSSNHAFLLTPEDTDGNGTPDRWFRDSNSDGKNDLMLDLGPNRDAFDVNNAGQVVGSLWTGLYQHAFRWQNGVTIDLGTLGGLSSFATAINDAGQVAGTSYTSTGERSAFLWQGGVMHDIGASGASDINQSGQVAATSYDASLWTPMMPNGTEGSFQSLGALPPDYTDFRETVSTYSIAAGVNDLGTVVGDSRTIHSYADPDGGYEYETSRVFVWAGGVMEDLLGEGVGLQHATAINNAGQIVGNGPYSYVFPGQTPNRAFLLTPESATTPFVNIDDVTITEGNSGTSNAVFTVRLSAASSQAVAVNFATTNGSATASGDYHATSGTLTFAPGETTKTNTVLVNGDRLPE